MAVGVRCTIHTCRHSVDDAEHWEDAREKIRAHFRMEHPAQVLDERRLGQNFTVYNETLDDYFITYLGEGVDWRNLNGVTAAQVVDVLRRLRRTADSFHPDVIQEAIVIALQHNVVLDPYDPLNPHDPAQQNAPHFALADEFIPDDLDGPDF